MKRTALNLTPILPRALMLSILCSVFFSLPNTALSYSCPKSSGPCEGEGSLALFYAREVIRYSSSFADRDPDGTGSYAATQALGRPNVFPQVGDNRNAWASETPDDQREFLELGYSVPIPIDSVIVYETLAGGAIDTIYVRNESSGEWNIVYTGEVEMITEARRFAVGFPMTAYSVDAVRLAINSPARPGRNEIDAVAILNSTLVLNITDSIHLASSEVDRDFNEGHGFTLGNATLSNLTWGATRQGSDKIIGMSQGGFYTYLKRFNLDGTLDTTFVDREVEFRARSIIVNPKNDDIYLGRNRLVKVGQDGIVDSAFTSDLLPGVAYDLSWHSGDKILATGWTFSSFFVARYHADGSLDSNFGTDGVYEAELNNGWGRGSRELSDGSIITQLNATDVNQTYLLKLSENGSLDGSFANGGMLSTATLGFESFTSNRLVVTEDEKFLVAGNGLRDGVAVSALFRLTSSGQLDAAFGNAGLVILPADGPNGTMLFAETNGNSLVQSSSGDLYLNAYTSVDSFSELQVSMLRFDESGDLDLTYGANGVAFAQLNDADISAVYSVPLDDGSIFKVGLITSTREQGLDMVALRFRRSDSATTSTNAELPAIQSFKLYPNPAVDALTLHVEMGDAARLDITVVSLAGRIMQRPLSAHLLARSSYQFNLPTHDLPSGMYLVRLQSGMRFHSIKFVKL